MKRLTRFGILILLIGASFFAVTIIRSNTQNINRNINNIEPNTFDNGAQSPMFWPLRELRLTSNLNVPVTLHILNSDGIEQWLNDKTITSVKSYSNTQHETFTIPLDSRGKYALLIYNPTDTPATGKLTFTFYGLEQDLLWSALCFSIAGAIITLTSLIYRKKNLINKHSLFP